MTEASPASASSSATSSVVAERLDPGGADAEPLEVLERSTVAAVDADHDVAGGPQGGRRRAVPVSGPASSTTTSGV